MKYFSVYSIVRCYLSAAGVGLSCGIIYPILGDIKKATEEWFVLSFRCIAKGLSDRPKPREVKLSFLSDFLYFFCFSAFFLLILYVFLDLTFRFAALFFVITGFSLGFFISKRYLHKFFRFLYEKVTGIYARFLIVITAPLRFLACAFFDFILAPVLDAMKIALKTGKTRKIIRQKMKSYSSFLLTRARKYDKISIA